jgi:hypothetical protein
MLGICAKLAQLALTREVLLARNRRVFRPMFIVVDVEAGRPCSHQAPSFANRLRSGRIFELHGSATLFSMDRISYGGIPEHTVTIAPGLNPALFHSKNVSPPFLPGSY